MKLHHTVIGTLSREHARSIEVNGIIPHVADAYKDLVPEEIRYLPVIWLAEGIWQGWEFPIFEVDTEDLDENYLYPTVHFFENDKQLGWWIYQGFIMPNKIRRLHKNGE